MHEKVAQDCGLVVSKADPSLAASPDLIVSFASHSKGLCEIKCPCSIRDSAPTVKNYSAVQESDGKVSLSTSH